MDMKKFVLGFALGLITSMAVGVFAANTDIFTAQKATFDIYVEGEKFESENPPLVVEGRTYLPLRTTGEALGVKVNWNESLRRVEIEKNKEGDEEMLKEETKQTGTTKDTSKSGEIFKEFVQSGVEYIKEVNGELYVTVNALGGNYIHREGDNWYISIPGRESLLAKVNNRLTEHLIEDRGYALVKLSSIGLEAEINGDTVILRYK